MGSNFSHEFNSADSGKWEKNSTNLNNANENSVNVCHTINNEILQKGLNSLDNPVLRGSFTLVLSEEKMTFFDKIAKEAFLEIFSDKLYTPNQNSPVLNTKYLKTSNCTQITKTSGVYVIKHIENGRAVTGQTVNFKGRFNQYTSRASRKKQTGSDNINRVMQFDTQKGFRENKVNFSQLFQRYIIYSWRSNLSNSLERNAQQSLLEQGEMFWRLKTK